MGYNYTYGASYKYPGPPSATVTWQWIDPGATPQVPPRLVGLKTAYTYPGSGYKHTQRNEARDDTGTMHRFRGDARGATMEYRPRNHSKVLEEMGAQEILGSATVSCPPSVPPVSKYSNIRYSGAKVPTKGHCQAKVYHTAVHGPSGLWLLFRSLELLVLGLGRQLKSHQNLCGCWIEDLSRPVWAI